MMDELVLLGRFEESPLTAWPGHCNAAQEVIFLRAGFRLEPFTLLRAQLHEQYYFRSSVEPVKQWFTRLAPTEQVDFATALYDDYYRDAAALAELTSTLAAANLATASVGELTTLVRQWMSTPARLGGPIFFTVLLDLWHEEGTIATEVIDIGGEARLHYSNVYDIQAKPQAIRLFAGIAHRVNATWEDLEMLFPEEILAWLTGATDVAERTAARQDFFVTMNVGGHYSILDGEEAAERSQHVELATGGEAHQDLTGRSAFPGSVEAPARKVLATADFRRLMDGDVLVAYQTSVKYEPLFGQVRAVVTELGGLTSHAAVVCREMSVSFKT